MTKQQYLSCIQYFNRHSISKKSLLLLSSLGPLLTFISYFALLLITFQKNTIDLFRFILIPASAFFLNTLLRKKFNRQRPFEVYQFTPLKLHSKGESFPSRHCTSALIIATSCLLASKTWGFFLIIDAILIGLTRVLMGVHFVKDVLGGYAIALIFSLLYFI